MVKQNIVIDYDETCAYMSEDFTKQSYLEFLKNPKSLPFRAQTFHMEVDNIEGNMGKGEVEVWIGILRPGVKEFLDFCFTRFDKVILWSAGIHKYVIQASEFIFKDTQYPHFVFTRNQCVPHPSKPDKLCKPLTFLKKYDPSIRLDNTFILDNTPYVADPNPENLIHIPDYRRDLTVESISEPDDFLLKLTDWLNRPDVMNSGDIRSLDKRYIFENPLETSGWEKFLRQMNLK